MPTLVEQLQRDAMDPNFRVSDLLRRVKFTAVQLGLGTVEDWVEQELNGYEGMPPAYRTVYGRPMAHNPYRGWEDIGQAPEWMQRRPNSQAIAVIEGFIAQAAATNSTQFHIPYPDELTEKLNKSNNTAGMNCHLIVSPAEMLRIVDKVRNLVLDWALNLQKAGIMGSEFNFNDAEKQKAHAAATVITIGSISNFQGNIGQGNVASDNSFKIGDLQPILEQLKPHLGILASSGATDISERVATLEKALAQQPANDSLVRGLVTDLRNTLTGAAGNLIATGAIAALNMVLGTGVPAV